MHTLNSGAREYLCHLVLGLKDNHHGTFIMANLVGLRVGKLPMCHADSARLERCDRSSL